MLDLDKLRDKTMDQLKNQQLLNKINLNKTLISDLQII